MIGNQIPRIRIEPERVASDGEGAALLMEAYGVTLDEYQRLVLDAWLGKNKNGDYTMTSGGLSLGRQNGKSEILIARCFYGLCVNGEAILATAHQVRSIKKFFRRLANMFENRDHPEITRMVKRVRYGVGEECIELKNGGLIEFMARSRQAARGFDGLSLLILDECMELGDDSLEALLAVLSSSHTGTRQVLYVGSPPYPGCQGDVFRRFRHKCITEAGSGNNRSSCWHEWSVAADSVDQVDINDRKLWYECNPAMGTRLTEEFTAEEAASLSPDGFCRERLGIWTKTVAAVTEKAIDPKSWAACVSDDPKPEGKTAYGVRFSVDGSMVVLAGAVLPKDGKGRISIIEAKPTGQGISWLAEWLRERYKKASVVVIDGKNGADLLVDKIHDVWVFKNSVIKPSAQNVVTAANLLVNEINEGTITWYRGQAALENSALTAEKRSIAGGWGFGGAESDLIAACSLALWGCRNTKRDPTRKLRIG